MHFLRKYILANAGLKLMALALSFLMWATYTSGPLAEEGFSVPLEFISIPSALEISGDVPITVQVRVLGRSALLRRITANDLNLSIDLKNAKQGVTLMRISPQMVVSPFGVKVVRVSPEQFYVTLTRRRGPPPSMD